MAHEKRVRSLYAGKFTEPLVELLSDPLSEIARTRQTALLVAASVSLLLSTGLAKLTEYGPAETKLIISPEYANRIFLAITAYLLVIYLLAVFADWSVASLKHSAAEELVRDIEATIQLDQKEQIARDTVRVRKREALSAEFDKLMAEKKAMTDPIAAQIDKLIQAPRDQFPSEEFFSLSEKLSDINKAYRARTEPLIEQMTVLDRQADLGSWLALVTDKEAVKHSRARFWFLSNCRLVLEILFPATYAIVAIVLALRHW